MVMHVGRNISSEWRLRFAAGLAAVLIHHASVVHGAVLINEIMLAASGQWIELHNTASAPVKLQGWSVRVGQSGVPGRGFPKLFFFAPSAFIPANGFLVIGSEGSNSTPSAGFVDIDLPGFFTFPPDGSAVGTGNVSNSIDIVSTGDVVEDSVNWTVNSSTRPEFNLPFTIGASLERTKVGSATQDPSNWTASTTPINETSSGSATGLTGTPGQLNSGTGPTTATTRPPTKVPTKAPVKSPTKAPASKGPTKAPVKVSKKPTKAPVEAPSKSPIAAVALPQLTGLDLFDSNTNLKIVTVTSGMSIAVPTSMKKSPALNMVATYTTVSAAPTIESVVFSFLGNARYQVEAMAPFALCANNGNDMFSCGPKTLGCGTHFVMATPYTGPNGTGLAGPSVSVTFSLIGCSGRKGGN